MDQNTCDLKCKCHDMKLLPIYCEDCECPVCTKCLTTSHLKHNVCDASDYVVKQRGKLMAAMHGEDSMFKELRSCLISQRKTLEERKTQLFDEISVREEDIVSVVREVGKHYKGIVSDAVVELEKNIQNSEKTLENISNNPELKTESEIDCIELLRSYGDLRRLQGEMKTHQNPLNFTFVTGKSISRISIEDLFGNFNGEIDHIDGSDEDRQIEKKSPIDGKNVQNILSCNRTKENEENKTILHEYTFTVDTLKDLKGMVFFKEKSFFHSGNKIFINGDATSVCKELQDVGCFSRLSAGKGILAVTNYGRTLRAYMNNGVCIKLYQTELSTSILAVEENVKKGISMLLECKYHENKQCQKRVTDTILKRKLYIRQLNENGETKLISSQKVGESGCPDVSKLCLLKNKATQVVIICKKSLYVYNQELSTLFVYHGVSRDNQYVPFTASCACLDPEDNILVANKTDNVVHMLDISGKFLRIILWPEESSLTASISYLSVDEDNWLWLCLSETEKPKLLFFDYDYLKKTQRIQRAESLIESAIPV